MRLQNILNYCEEASWLFPGLARRAALALARVTDTIMRADDRAGDVIESLVPALLEVEGALLAHDPVTAEENREAERMERDIAKQEAAQKLSLN